MEQQLQNRRRGVRIGASGQGTYTIVDPGFPARAILSGSFLVEDLSVRGARLAVEGLPPEHIDRLASGDEILSIDLCDLTGGDCRAIGFVRWHTQLDQDHCRLGVEFSDMPRQHEAVLREYLSRLLEASGISMDDPAREFRRKLRTHSSYIVGAAAVLLGIFIGTLFSRPSAPQPRHSVETPDTADLQAMRSAGAAAERGMR